ncbi:hypothetical protein JCM17039_16980 [Blautia glucerasea]
MTVDIDTLYEMLDEEQPIEIQEAALREARKIKSLSVFMQPVEYKWSWENCAKVICEKTDEELNNYTYEMLEWLQDLNWPGAFLIMERLEKMDPQLLVHTFIYKVKQALLLKDTEWLGRMSYLLKNKKFYDALSEDKKYQKIMRRYYESYWGELKY